MAWRPNLLLALIVTLIASSLGRIHPAQPGNASPIRRDDPGDDPSDDPSGAEPTTDDRPESVSIPLFADIARPGIHIAELKIGPNEKLFRVILDTASTSFTVASSLCSNCPAGTGKLVIDDGRKVRPVLCTDAAVCASGKCSDAKNDSCAFRTEFGTDFALDGALVYSMVSLGDGNRARERTFGAVTRQTGFEALMGQFMDGVLGVGPLSGTLECDPDTQDCPVAKFEAYVRNKRSDVSMCLSGVGGILTFGKVNDEHYTGEIKYFDTVDQEKKDGYRLKVFRMEMGGVDVSAGDEPSEGQLRIDTRAEKLRVSPSTYKKVRDAILATEGICDIKYVCADEGKGDDGTIFEPGSCVNFDPKDLDKFPKFDLHIGLDFNFSLSGRDYFFPIEIGSSFNTYFCFAFKSAENIAEGDIDFGIAGLHGIFTVLDRENGRVGFSSSYDCETQGCASFKSCGDCTRQPLCFWCSTDQSCRFKDEVLEDRCPAPMLNLTQCTDPATVPQSQAPAATSSPQQNAMPEATTAVTPHAPQSTSPPSYSEPSDSGGGVSWSRVKESPIILGSIAGVVALLGLVMVLGVVRRRRRSQLAEAEGAARQQQEGERLVEGQDWQDDEDWD